MRHQIAPVMQRTADAAYGGDEFPQPDSDLTKTVLTDLPNVVGKSVDEATNILQEAGFDVIVGDPVDSTEGAGIVVGAEPRGRQGRGRHCHHDQPEQRAGRRLCHRMSRASRSARRSAI